MSDKNPTKKELEAKVQKLESQVSHIQTNQSPRQGWRKFFAAVLIFLTAVTISTAIKAYWLHNTLFDTATFTNKTTQIIQTPSVKTDLSTVIVNSLFEKVDVQKYVSEALPKQGQPLVGPITSALQKFSTDQVNNALGSQQFVDFWKKAVGSAHKAAITSLNELNSRSQESARDQVIFIDRDQVIFNAQPVISQLKTKLSDAGLSFVNNINTENLNITYPIATITYLPIVLGVFNGINAAAFWLPILVVVLAACAIAVSTNRRRALVSISIVTIVIMVIDVLTLRVANVAFSQQISQSFPALSSQSAQSIFHILTDDLVGYFKATLWLSVIVIVFAVLAGPSKWAVWVRQHIADLASGQMKLPALQWLAQNAYTVVGVMVAITALVVVFAPFSSVAFAVWTSVIVGIVCILILSLKLAHATKQTRSHKK